MRADYIRIYKSVHTWTGILSGMALFIAFYAGALTVFKEPIRHWVTPPAAMVQVVPMDAVQPLIARAMASTPAAARGAVVHLEGDSAVPRVEWQVRDPKAGDHDESAVRHYRAELASDGTLQVNEQPPARLVELIDTLHRVVGLPFDSDANRWFMGVISALYFVALVSGVIVLLPSLVKDFFAMRVGRNLKRMWLDAHNVVGIVSLPFHLVMALSAVVFAFHDQIFEVQDQFLYEGRWSQTAARPPGGKSSAVVNDPARMLPPSRLVQLARDASPGFVPNRLQYAQVTGPKPTVRVWGHHPEGISPRAVGGFAMLDPYTGELLSKDYLSGGQTTPNLIISSFFALHMASFGGWVVGWMYFLLGLAGAWLFYSGNLLWVETRRKAQRKGAALPTQRRDTYLMAAASVGVCLGCVSGISLTMAAAKWLPGRVDDLAAWHMGIYYVAFFACIGWAFARGGARASVHLLWTAAVCTAVIPLSSLLGWAMPDTGAWMSASWLGVDATAITGTLALVWMARATARRVRSGPADSVWSAKTSQAGATDGTSKAPT
ncbi:PepSY-associated TM helix domain-containing protein [Comamonas sp. NoAH]|uniref:PepSY-associated TM helix domain-containing protein n=1 Tax=Comamonas halotolerans TaxID=3041496 RepID=UPI0024E04ABA|nr:PepSY-associated TM helix domain-containing protein [Comamonas sp. NoAH]